MGYFSNGTEGELYQEHYCFRCIHWSEDEGCPIWDTHLLRNYDDCNKPDSILHILIPRSKDHLSNERCTMFIAAPAMRDLLK